jgi:hypothetical protein
VLAAHDGRHKQQLAVPVVVIDMAEGQGIHGE